MLFYIISSVTQLLLLLRTSLLFFICNCVLKYRSYFAQFSTYCPALLNVFLFPVVNSFRLVLEKPVIHCRLYSMVFWIQAIKNLIISYCKASACSIQNHSKSTNFKPADCSFLLPVYICPLKNSTYIFIFAWMFYFYLKLCNYDIIHIVTLPVSSVQIVFGRLCFYQFWDSVYIHELSKISCCDPLLFHWHGINNGS